MARHKFAIGAEVRLISRTWLSPTAAETYRVISLLPIMDLSPQYRLRNDELGQERVSKEDNLSVLPESRP
ncbi:hypothetical protein [Rhizobium giardinii]|uniref:hypothetical protein n=1 Tax=Rhizobium giardinii TaxID=56731 RepID=UPI0009FD319F|nr:hypothetical protein [Rhizobium giardinii]